MSIIFRDISGRTISIQLGKESRVFNACQLLSKKLQISADKIFLLSPKEEINYYNNNEMIEHVKEENPEYVVFTSLYQNEKKNNKEDPTELGLKDKSYLTNSIPIKALIRLISFKYDINADNLTYKKYCKCINEIPSDLQQKIDEISILGYEIEDIKEALRAKEYNVLYAVDLLVQRNSINSQIKKGSKKKAQPKLKPQPQLKSQKQPQSQQQPQLHTQSQLQSQQQPQLHTQSQSQSQQPQLHTQSQSQSQQPQLHTQSQSQSQQQPQLHAQSQTQPKSQLQTQFQPQSQSHPLLQTQSQSQPQPESQPQHQFQSKLQYRPQHQYQSPFQFKYQQNNIDIIKKSNTESLQKKDEIDVSNKQDNNNNSSNASNQEINKLAVNKPDNYKTFISIKNSSENNDSIKKPSNSFSTSKPIDSTNTFTNKKVDDLKSSSTSKNTNTNSSFCFGQKTTYKWGSAKFSNSNTTTTWGSSNKNKPFNSNNWGFSSANKLNSQSSFDPFKNDFSKSTNTNTSNFCISNPFSVPKNDSTNPTNSSFSFGTPKKVGWVSNSSNSNESKIKWGSSSTSNKSSWSVNKS